MDAIAERVSRDQIIRRKRGQFKSSFPVQLITKQNCQPYSVGAQPSVVELHTAVTGARKMQSQAVRMLQCSEDDMRSDS